MHSVYNPQSLHGQTTNPELEFQLNWLLRENELAEKQGRAFRNAREEEELLLMRRPVAARQAYAKFGLLLGTLPPAAIFFKLFLGLMVGSDINVPLCYLLLFMNVACALAGAYFGSKLSGMASEIEGDRWLTMILGAACLGFIWGAATGAAGGILFFGFGAIYGALYAIPVGVLAFVLFVPFHRLLARGGMIDARHLWPLACGVVLFITALILGQ